MIKKRNPTKTKIPIRIEARAGAVAASRIGRVPERPSRMVKSWKKYTPKPQAALNRITRAMPPSRPSLSEKLAAMNTIAANKAGRA